MCRDTLSGTRFRVLYGTLFRLSKWLGWRKNRMGIKKNRRKARDGTRPPRADAQRNLEALINAAKVVFAKAGVDAPVREIAEKAGVGLGTVYRHFPQRSDLIAAVFRYEVDACARASVTLAAEHEPADALCKWLVRFSDFVATKKGLAPALHSGDPAYKSLRGYFDQNLRPAIDRLLARAMEAGQIRKDVDAEELMYAVAHLSSASYYGSTNNSHRLVSILVDGLRYGAQNPSQEL